MTILMSFVLTQIFLTRVELLFADDDDISLFF